MSDVIVDPNNPITIFQNWLRTENGLDGNLTLNQLWVQFNPFNTVGSLPFDPTGIDRLVALLQATFPGSNINRATVTGWVNLNQALAQL
jgi:hypothetical protein